MIEKIDFIGTSTCGISSAIGWNQDSLNCVNDVQTWEYHTRMGGWTNAGASVDVRCVDIEGKFCFRSVQV